MYAGSTIKQGCNAGVKLILSEDKRHLEVTYVSENHNHMMNKVSVVKLYIFEFMLSLL